MEGRRKGKVCVLGSGSGGNACFFSYGKTRILVDAGLSGRAIVGRLGQIGEDPRRVDGLVVTHEHNDHVASVATLSRRYRLPVYLTEGTRQAAGGLLDGASSLHCFEAGGRFPMGDIEVEAYTVPHDARDPVALNLYLGEKKITLCTDLGYGPLLVRERIRNAHLLILESNHDPTMLMEGPYPWPIKQRIRSRKGHLSNEEACELLRGAVHGGLARVVLAHLSQENNLPELARLAAVRAVDGFETVVEVAHQDTPTEVIFL